MCMYLVHAYCITIWECTICVTITIARCCVIMFTLMVVLRMPVFYLDTGYKGSMELRNSRAICMQFPECSEGIRGFLNSVEPVHPGSNMFRSEQSVYMFLGNHVLLIDHSNYCNRIAMIYYWFSCKPWLLWVANVDTYSLQAVTYAQVSPRVFEFA